MKTCITAFAQGFGQLMDYSFRLKTAKEKKLVIVGPNFPNDYEPEFIQSIKSILQIPFSYLFLDEANFTVEEF